MPNALTHPWRPCTLAGGSLVLAALSALLALVPRPLAAATGSWQPIGPEGGAVVSLAVDPTDPGTVYAATGLGLGLYKTVDAGGSWSRIGASMSLGVLKLVRLAIDANHPGVVPASNPAATPAC